MARRGDDIGGRPLLDKAPGIQNGDPVGGFGNHPHIMGDQDHCGAALLAQPPQQRQHLRLDGDVKGRCRLVGDDQLRLGRQRQRDDDPLAHPAGEFMRKGAAALGVDPHFLEKLYRARLGSLTGQAEMKLDGLDQLVADGAKRVQARQRVLKDHADLAAAHRRRVILDPAALQRDGAGGDAARRLKQPHDGGPGQRLAGAAFTNKAQHLSGLEAKGNSVERLQPLTAERKFHAEITNIEKRRGHFSLGFSVSFSQSPSRFTDSANASNVTAGKARIHHSPENR